MVITGIVFACILRKEERKDEKKAFSVAVITGNGFGNMPKFGVCSRK
jgi:hypothetical protein